VGTTIVFETHSVTEDNERGFATGWLPGRLSERGRVLAHELGVRRRHDGLSAVFTSDLQRAVETTSIAFNGSGLPVLADWRLRECDFGSLNGAPRAACTRTSWAVVGPSLSRGRELAAGGKGGTTS
jgi:broad specificity phosphatase PhoE